MTAAQNPARTPVVFIPAVLCDAQLYREVIADLGDAIKVRDRSACAAVTEAAVGGRRHRKRAALIWRAAWRHRPTW